jgi:hypothetical protein
VPVNGINEGGVSLAIPLAIAPLGQAWETRNILIVNEFQWWTVLDSNQ